MQKSEAQINSRRIVDKLDSGNGITSDDLAYMTDQLQNSTERWVLNNLFYLCRRLEDPVFIPLLERHLGSRDVNVASGALWVLCWLGQAERLKPYLLETVDTGFASDPERKIGCTALVGAGLHLKTHLDRDLAQLLIRWAPPEDRLDLDDWPLPRGMIDYDLQFMVGQAGTGMGIALGADPAYLVNDTALEALCVKRFLIERQDG